MQEVPSPAFSFTLSVRQVYKSSFSMFCSHLFSCSSRSKNLEISCRADQRLLLIKNIQTPFSIRSKQHHKLVSCMMHFFSTQEFDSYIYTHLSRKRPDIKIRKLNCNFPLNPGVSNGCWSPKQCSINQDQPSTNSLNAQCHFIGREKATRWIESLHFLCKDLT